MRKKILLSIIIIALFLIGYYIYYKNSNIYKEFEYTSKLEELIPYKEEGKLQEENESEQADQNAEITGVDNTKKIVVHITGEVNNCGVIELEKGSRVIDAVNVAGGFTEKADIEKVNLAYVLSDAIKIYIPSKNKDEENVTNTQECITTNSGENIIMKENQIQKSNNSIVNINEATQTELETLPGIGPSTALKIISYREENGKFLSTEDIKNVSGIGDNKFNTIKDFICI